MAKASKSPGKPKTSKKKPGLADKVTKKSSKAVASKSSVNPFEVKLNKQKFDILGRSKAATKHERGRPGVSRAKANQKRAETLLPEFRNRFKENKFVDMRIGETNTNLTAEDKMAMRFAAERLKSHTKKSKFNLGEDEVLTHHGQSLIDIEKFEDPRSDSEDEANPKLDKDFVSDAHFGGFLSKADNSDESLKKRETLIDQLIADSKRRKEERQKEREETTDLTEELDMEYKTVVKLLNSVKKSGRDTESNVTSSAANDGGGNSSDPNAAYDLLVREMRFEVRGKPTDKLKSADEIARLEKEKLEKLEADRLRRMHGDMGPAAGGKIPHRSADSLEDDFDYGNDTEESRALSYSKEGVEVNLGKIANKNKEEEEQVDDDDDDEEGEEGEEEEEDDENEEEEDDEDEYSDLQSDAESESEETTQERKSEKRKVPEKTKLKSAANGAEEDLPFVFKVPASYEDFYELMTSYREDRQVVVLERMLKCTHPSLDSGNRGRLEELFAFLLQYVNDSSDQGISVLSRLVPSIFDLVQLISSSSAASMLLDVILEKRDEFQKQTKKQPVSIATIVFLKLTELIYPASDFRHCVVTPAVQFIVEALLCPVNSREAVAVGLALCSLVYEYTAFSRRYTPEVSHFLNGVLVLAQPRDRTKAASISFPFRPVGEESQLLVLRENADSKSLEPRKLKLTELSSVKDSDESRVSLVHTAVCLIRDFAQLWSELPAAKEILKPMLANLEKLPRENLNEKLTSAIDEASGKIKKVLESERSKLVHEAKRPKPLKLFEPAFEESFDGRKKRVGSKEKLEQQKLQHKLKREMKGAIREIRRDNAFLAKHQLKEQIQKDAERNQKVKRLLSSLAVQESDVRKIKKAKRK